MGPRPTVNRFYIQRVISSIHLLFHTLFVSHFSHLGTMLIVVYFQCMRIVVLDTIFSFWRTGLCWSYSLRLFFGSLKLFKSIYNIGRNFETIGILLKSLYYWYFIFLKFFFHLLQNNNLLVPCGVQCRNMVWSVRVVYNDGEFWFLSNVVFWHTTQQTTFTRFFVSILYTACHITGCTKKRFLGSLTISGLITKLNFKPHSFCYDSCWAPSCLT